MTRSYSVLAVALVGVAGLAGIARLVQGEEVAGGSVADIVESTSPVTAVTIGDPESREVPSVPPANSDAPVATAAPGRGVDDITASGDLADAVRAQQQLEPIVVIDPECELSRRLELGDNDPQVKCLESQLIAAGALSSVRPDELFDRATEDAVRTFQEAKLPGRRRRGRSADRQRARVLDRARRAAARPCHLPRVGSIGGDRSVQPARMAVRGG